MADYGCGERLEICLMPTLVEQAIAEETSASTAPARVDGWLNPARGIAIGIALGLIAWTAIGALTWLLIT